MEDFSALSGWPNAITRALKSGRGGGRRVRGRCNYERRVGDATLLALKVEIGDHEPRL